MGKRFLSILAAFCLIATSLVIAQELRGSSIEGKDVLLGVVGQKVEAPAAGTMSTLRQASHSPQEQQSSTSLLHVLEEQERQLARSKQRHLSKRLLD